MKKLFLILLLGLSAYYSQGQTLRINRYLVDSMISAGVQVLYYDTTHTGQWKNISQQSGGGGGSGSGTVSNGTQYRIAYYATTGTTVSQAAAITASRALVSDINGVPTHSAVTTTELGYVSGVTSAIQTQLNSKGDALTTNPLSQFAATTSLQLLGVISDETGSGSLVFGTSPTIVTPTIASFANATHNHTNAAGGGQLTDAALSAAVSVSKGGTGLTSIAGLSVWVANSANTITTVTPAAGQSVRINAGGTAWEAFTPGGGGDVTQAGNNAFTGLNTFTRTTAGASYLLTLRNTSADASAFGAIEFFNNSGTTPGTHDGVLYYTSSTHTYPSSFGLFNFQTGGHIVFGTESTERLRIQNNGEVWIGGADLGAYALSVTGAVAISTNLDVTGNINTGTWNATAIGVTKGGTGLTSIAGLSVWVANSANTITTVTPAAGQSIRINAGGTAWEAFTPGSGGGDVTKVGTPANDQLAVWTGDGTLGAESTATFNSTDGLHVSGYRSTGPKLRVGDFVFQPSSLNNSMIMDNLKYVTGGWEYLNSGKGSGFQLYDGQGFLVAFAAGTGGLTGTAIYSGKWDYSGVVALGGTSISTTDGSYTGAGLIVSETNTKALGNILMGGTSVATSATKTFHLYNGTVPSASITDGVLLYSEDVAASAELKVRDEAGNITVLGPHTFTGIPGGRSEEMAWAFYSERDGKYINVDMLKLARAVEKLTGEKLVYIGSTKDELPNKENK
jgi:hypothetical protein